TLPGHEIACPSVAGANGRAAITARIPRHTDTRSDIRPHRFHAGRAGKAWIARVIQSWRCLRIDGTASVRTDARHVEGVERLVLAVLREPRLPARTIVHGEMRRRAPGILPVRRKVGLRDVLAERRRFAELEHAPKEEVPKRKAGDAAAERARTPRADGGFRFL